MSGDGHRSVVISCVYLKSYPFQTQDIWNAFLLNYAPKQVSKSGSIPDWSP